MNQSSSAPLSLLGLIVSLLSFSATAYDPGAKFLGTGGAVQIEGAAGGGIVPWAVIGGYAQQGEWSAEAFATQVSTDDYFLQVKGFSFSYSNRIEITAAEQSFDITSLSNQLNLPESNLGQKVYGIKAKVAGDLIYGAMPQLAIGLQHKQHQNFIIPSAVGAEKDNGTDYYIAATKLWLDGIAGYPILLNATARHTEANQTGLLGFGNADNKKSWLLESSIGFMPSRNVMIGAEYRQKPDHLGFAEEEDWMDVFVAWFPNKHMSLTMAWAQLGSIATLDQQNGLYLSIQGSF